MKSFKNFMQRSAGEWKSLRRYYYPKAEKIDNLISDLTVEFIEDHPDGDFGVNLTWLTKKVESNEVQSEGEMLTVAKGRKLLRNVGYMSDDATVCDVTMIDENCVEFITEYGGFRFREEIRLIGEDIRLRQTIGWKGERVVLVGQYWETRKTDG